MKLHEKFKQLNVAVTDIEKELKAEIHEYLHVSIRKNYDDKMQIQIGDTSYSNNTNINVEDWEKLKQTVDELLNKEVNEYNSQK